MGCSAQGSWLSRCGAAGITFLFPWLAQAQTTEPSPAFDRGPSLPAVEPAPPAAQPAPPANTAATPRAEAPPLDPPPPTEPTSRPSFIRAPEPSQTPPVAPLEPSDEFLSNASPWLDFTLTSFYFDERVGNFLNLGAQFGAYAFDRLRIAGRILTPLDDVEDGGDNFFSSNFGGGSSSRALRSRSVSLLYGASVGLVVTNSKAFVFGPNLGFLRTDVEDYGTAIALGLPFEWTTRKNLRVGFELSLGHALGGTLRRQCIAGTSSCGLTRESRPGGTAVIFQFDMGWALGRL